MRREPRLRQMTWPRTRGVQKSAAGSAGTIYLRLCQLLHTFGIVGALLPVVIDESGPPFPEADDAVAFAQRADRDRSYRGIETGNVTTAGENRDCSLLRDCLGFRDCLSFCDCSLFCDCSFFRHA